MPILQGPAATGKQAICYPDSAGDVVANRFEMTIPAAGIGAAVADILEIGSIPANCRVVEMTIDNDTNIGATFTCDVGIMSGTFGSTDQARTVGAEFFSAQAVSLAGLLTQMTLATGLRAAPTAQERSIGLKILTRTTPAAGKIAVTVQLATG